MPLEAVVIDTGGANLASVAAALARQGLSVRTTTNPELVRSAPCVVLPGVGAFGPAMDRLRDAGLDDALRDRIAAGKPLLGICLGMQLLFEASQESPGVAGLGVMPGCVERFGPGARVPQMGWNRVTPTPGATLLEADAMYFANSYRIAQVPAGWEGATAEHAGPFVAAIERGPILACQFHPELSGRAGSTLIGRWIERARECTAC